MDNIGSILNLAFGLILLWLLWFFGWRQYRVDLVRHKLFELRNELFIYAADGGIRFNDPAYTHLRSSIESLIRFAHKMTFTRIVLFGVQHQRTPMDAVVRNSERWTSSLNNLNESTHKKITDIHNRVYIVVAIHLLNGCFPLFAFALLSHTYSRFKSQTLKESELNVAKKMGAPMMEEQAAIADRMIPEDDLVLA